MIKYISFDLDGTVADNSFDEIIWRKRIPELYAREKNVTVDRAFETVTTEYARLYGKEPRWRDIAFWFEHFGLQADWQKIVQEEEKNIIVYADVEPVLRELHHRYKVIVISHADRKFMEPKLKICKVTN
ncbi:MAG: HAD family hydrolase [Candidatus Woesearchaeota archaeon]